MDLLIVLTLASGLLVLLCLFFLLKQKKTKDTGNDEVEPQQRAQEGQRPRRAVAARNQRVRLRAGAQEQQNLDENEEEAAAKPAVEFSDKVGAKKRAKMEAKAERKAQREAEVHAREERKRRQELEAEERQKEEELAEKEREKREEEEQKVREEKERQEHEEYLKMKAMFSVEEEGFEEGGSDDSEGNLLQEFIAYIKKTKVVVLEDLAATFKLRTQHVIDRIQELQNEGTLTGVIDDRGKFIYISEAELAAVAKFVKQRGRVSISELAESSNKLINLNPNQPTVPVES